MPTSDPFEIAQAPLHQVDFRAITESLDGNGILATGDLKITDGSTGMEVDVAAGDVQYNSTVYTLSSATTKTLSDGDPDDDRWDTIAFDTATSSVTVREGTADPAPVAPDIQGDELYLGKIYVAAGSTALGSEDIYNWRASVAQTSKSGVQELVERPNGEIDRAEIEDTSIVDFGVPVPDTYSLEVYRWGCWRQDDTTPTGLDVVLLDESRTVQTSANTDDSGVNTTLEAGLTNSSGSTSHYYLGIQNTTGNDLLASNSEWVTGIFAYQVV